MKFYRKLSKISIIQKVVAWLLANYLTLVYRTTKWAHQGEHYILDYVQQDRPCIIAFWHNRIMMGPFAWHFKKPFYMLISSHSDGVLISKTVGHLGINTVAGSTSRGGLGAVKHLITMLKQGHYIGITPDGPRGPRFIASEGIINLARLAQCDIVPLCYNVKRNKILRSWDRFIVPLPFTQGIIAWGKPFKLHEDSATVPYQLAAHLTQQMLDLSADVDHFCDQAMID